MSQPASSNRPRWYVYCIGAVIVLLLGAIWFKTTYLSPQNVFWGMVRNSLAVQSVTTEVSQGTGSSKMQQTIQFELGTTRLVRSYVDLTEAPSEVKSEMIGTPQADYSKYLSITTTQKNTKPLNTKGIVNVWAKSSTQSSAQGDEHLFAQALLGATLGDVPIPVGNITPAESAQLVTQMQQSNAYSASFTGKGVSMAYKHGRLFYTYHITVEPVSYLGVMKTFAKDEGLNDLNSLNPNSYESVAALPVTLTVDALSHQLVSVNTGQGYVQTYTAYGVPVEATVPAHAISATELQNRISKIQ